jgi:hypothetical protein
MKKLVINVLDGRFIAAYNDEGLLVYFEVVQMPSEERVKLLFFSDKVFPSTNEMLLHITARNRGKVSFHAVPEDLSFERFWNDYGYKVGKKDRVSKLWSAMNEADKSKALLAIPRYKLWLSQRSIEMVYPETFLSQRRWENDYR